jgi:hypothetical protein
LVKFNLTDVSKILINRNSFSKLELLFFSLPSSALGKGGGPDSRKSNRLKKIEKLAFTVPKILRDILVGLLLGDLHGRFRYNKTSFAFKQGISHKEYISHLYELFQKYSPSAPKINESLPDPRTGKVYKSIIFTTYTLPCFNELYNLFYLSPSRQKIVPDNIEELLTSRSLAYWIADDGSWNKVGKYISLSTDSFKLEEVELLIEVLNKKFNFNSYKVKNGKNYKIIIPSYSISTLQKLVLPYIPSMMTYKIGL